MTGGAATETVGLVQQFVEQTGQLYSLPAAAAEVLRLTSEPRIDTAALKTCLETDPALAARILRVVNSSLFGPSRQVTDLNQALTLLGIRPLKMLVLGFSLPKELFAGLRGEVLARYWRQTLIKAVAARELSEQLWRVPGDEPFLAGLVQDIGLLALIQRLGEPYEQLLAHAQAQGGSLLEKELDTLGLDHLVLSARLLAHWGLPPALCAAISMPPDEGRIAELDVKERTLPRMLHLAELLARLIEQPFGSALRDLLNIGSRYCGLTYEQLQPIVAVVQQKVAELAQVLSLQLPDGQSYIDLLLAAQARLADESLAVAIVPRETEEELLLLADKLRSELAVVSRANPRDLAKRATRPVEPSPKLTAALADAEWSGDPKLANGLRAAVLRARQMRTPLTLALIELDRFGDVLLLLGPGAMHELLYVLRAAVAEWTGQKDEAWLISDSRLAMIWEDCPRGDAVQMARQVLSTFRPWTRQQFPHGSDLTLSIGLATLAVVPKNYPPLEMIVAAERCLSGAQLSGGDAVKSIEI